MLILVLMAVRIRVNLAPFPLRLRPFRHPRKAILAGWPSPLKAGLRPPPPAANGLDRGWLPGCSLLIAFDGEVG